MADLALAFATMNHFSSIGCGVMMRIRLAVVAGTFLLSVAGAQASALVARVDVAEQKMVVSQYGKVIHEWTVSTGADEFGGTPRGEYRPYRMHKMWRSRTHNGEEMPYSVFYDRGWAVHGTNEVDRLGSPVSHGCVRLDPQHAEIFYSLVNKVGAGNTRIIIEN
ncbi:hypothetical protein L610_002200000600 [Aminobacter sp. J44]|nr:hypothetical protein L610_002200000600 [Aminobacter sp. J44]